MSTNNKNTTTTAKKAKAARPKKNKKVNATAKKAKFTQVANHAEDLAEGARSNIMIIGNLDESSIQAGPESLVTMGYTKGWYITSQGKNMYWAYIAFINDLVAILGSKIAPVSGRLEYLNSILASYMPKSVPFKTSTLDYSWDDVNSVPTTPEITNRGFRYYMYEQTASVAGSSQWYVQTPPPNPTTADDVYPVLSVLYTLLARDFPGKRFVKDATFGPEYQKDVSAFASVSPYFGQGNSNSSSTSASVESEVPFKSNILANLTPYTQAAGRVARNFNVSSGDSTAALGLGLTPDFHIENYATRYPPIYKFLDLDEVVTTIQLWWTGLVEQAINTQQNFQLGTPISFALQPFPYTARQFKIAIRQCVLSMFANSAALTQNLRYSNASNSFEPFRCGSNCYPPVLSDQIQLPVTLIENLRMLLMRTYDIQTRFHNPKNKLFVIPVWGVFKSAPDPNVFGTFLNEEGSPVPSFMFTGVEPSDPNIIDGTNPNDEVCDFNKSPYLTSIISDWNDRLQYLKQYSIPTGPLGGDGNGILLTMTRYCIYNQQEIDLKNVSNLQRCRLPKEFVVKRKIQRTLSTKGNSLAPVEEKEVYVPPNASLGAQYTTAFSSVSSITDTVKQMVSYFIYPHIVLEPGNVPTSPQNRTYTVEGNIIDIPRTANSLDSTRNRLQNYASTFIVGTAGSKNDEMASLIAHLNDTGAGGFLSSIVQQLAPLIPF